MNTGGHYRVHRFNGDEREKITRLDCCHCQLTVDVLALHRAGDRSGLPRYGRARAKIVEHLHAKHRDALT